MLESARDRENMLHVPTVFVGVGVNGQALQKHKLELNHHGRLFLLFELPLVWPFNEGSLPCLSSLVVVVIVVVIVVIIVVVVPRRRLYFKTCRSPRHPRRCKTRRWTGCLACRPRRRRRRHRRRRLPRVTPRETRGGAMMSTKARRGENRLARFTGPPP